MAFRRLRAILEAPEDLRNTLEEALDKAREIVPEQVQIDQNDYFVFETELKFQAVIHCVDEKKDYEQVFKYGWDNGLDEKRKDYQEKKDILNAVRMEVREKIKKNKQGFIEDHPWKEFKEEFIDYLEEFLGEAYTENTMLSQVEQAVLNQEFIPDVGEPVTKSSAPKAKAKKSKNTKAPKAPSSKRRKTNRGAAVENDNDDDNEDTESKENNDPEENKRTPSRSQRTVRRSALAEKTSPVNAAAAKNLREKASALNTRGVDPLDEANQLAANAGRSRRSKRGEVVELEEQEGEDTESETEMKSPSSRTRAKRQQLKLDAEQADAEKVEWDNDLDNEKEEEDAEEEEEEEEEEEDEEEDEEEEEEEQGKRVKLPNIHIKTVKLRRPKRSPKKAYVPAGRKQRVKWTKNEENNLKKGVDKFGKGKWEQIKSTFEFMPQRTAVDLKDKWRNMDKKNK